MNIPVPQRWRQKEAEEAAAFALWAIYHESKTMDDVSRMTGSQFEEFLARLLSQMGYREITLTAVNDQGGDILCLSPSGEALVIQAKRWKGSVGNDAVQELLGGMRHYGRNKGMVITNSTFTRAAVQLAATASDVTLYDKGWLEEQIKRYFPSNTPTFNRERFDEIVKDLCEMTRGLASVNAQKTGKRRVRIEYTFIGMLRSAAAAKGRALTAKEIMEVTQRHVSIRNAQEALLAAEKNMLSR